MKNKSPEIFLMEKKNKNKKPAAAPNIQELIWCSQLNLNITRQSDTYSRSGCSPPGHNQFHRAATANKVTLRPRQNETKQDHRETHKPSNMPYRAAMNDCCFLTNYSFPRTLFCLLYRYDLLRHSENRPYFLKTPILESTCTFVDPPKITQP